MGCVIIPQQVAGHRHESKRACVASLSTAERQGLFCLPRSTGKMPLGENPNTGRWRSQIRRVDLLNTFRDLPYDALDLYWKNVLDSSHVSFTHHRSGCNRKMPVQ